MFNDAEWSALVAKLHQLTDGNRVKWELDGFELSLRIGDVTYVITALDEDGVPPWVLHVRKHAEDPDTDYKWTEIDALRSKPGWNSGDPQVQLLELRDLAYRMALGGPQLAQHLLDDLDRIDATPPTPAADTPF